MADYSIWALEFAVLPSYPDSALVYGKADGARVLPFYYFVVQSEDRLILIDSGFSDNAFCTDACASYGVEKFIPPAEAMSRIGLDPHDVDTIIISHHHWDHVSGVPYFPRAEVWIQRRDIENWTEKWHVSDRLGWLKGGLDPDTGDDLARVDAEGRLRPVDGHAPVAPDIDVRPAYDTHTAGSQYVVLQASDGPWIFPGDVAYVYENIGGTDGSQPMIPIGLGQGNQECCVRLTDEMLTAAGDDVGRVLCSHEVRIWDRFPSIVADDGLHIAEIALAPGVPSRIGSR
ncbi:MBL fold metallo-hydrolase [Microbacterium sp. X-17]|uniref:MBL fold metallo-hydrolase n=1 Tax=Microbacterium sp. X-17 TaxID=3144404 RepID=UPI0031F558A5